MKAKPTQQSFSAHTLPHTDTKPMESQSQRMAASSIKPSPTPTTLQPKISASKPSPTEKSEKPINDGDDLVAQYTKMLAPNAYKDMKKKGTLGAYKEEMQDKLGHNVAFKYTDMNTFMSNERFHTKLQSQITKQALKDKGIIINKSNKNDYTKNRELLNDASKELRPGETMSPMLQAMTEIKKNNPNLFDKSLYYNIANKESPNNEINKIGENNYGFYQFITGKI